jgi:hypothetical protein
MNGTMLISESDVCVFFASCGIFSSGGRTVLAAESLRKCFLDLGGDFQRKGVEALAEIANVLQELIIENYGWDRGG